MSAHPFFSHKFATHAHTHILTHVYTHMHTHEDGDRDIGLWGVIEV